MSATMNGSLQGLLQCPHCHQYVADKEVNCPQCDGLLPKGKAQREARGRMMPASERSQREAYERFKLEVTHVPRWLRQVVAAFQYAYGEPMPHAIVQWGSGLLAFGMAFSAMEPLRDYVPPSWSLKGMSFMGLQVIVGTVAFIFVSRFIFALFRKNIEIMLGVFCDEQDALILRGRLDEQFQHWTKD